jgi:hypothetical protein
VGCSGGWWFSAGDGDHESVVVVGAGASGVVVVGVSFVGVKWWGVDDHCSSQYVDLRAGGDGDGYRRYCECDARGDAGWCVGVVVFVV